jgi:hypothetical protein
VQQRNNIPHSRDNQQDEDNEEIESHSLSSDSVRLPRPENDNGETYEPRNAGGNGGQKSQMEVDGTESLIESDFDTEKEEDAY